MNQSQNEESGKEDSSYDIYKDSLVRFLGYSNEVGEAFRPLIPRAIVNLSYGIAIAYSLADTIDKGRSSLRVSLPLPRISFLFLTLSALFCKRRKEKMLGFPVL